MTDRIRVLALGVFRAGDRILLARGTDPATGAAFYRPLGGGVEHGERAAAALAREIEEELGAALAAPRLIGVLENLFAYDGRAGHEIVFVFDAAFADPAWYRRDAIPVTEGGTGWEDARWIPLGALADGPVPVVPAGLLSLLEADLRAHPPAHPAPSAPPPAAGAR